MDMPPPPVQILKCLAMLVVCVESVNLFFIKSCSTEYMCLQACIQQCVYTDGGGLFSCMACHFVRIEHAYAHEYSYLICERMHACAYVIVGMYHCMVYERIHACIYDCGHVTLQTSVNTYTRTYTYHNIYKSTFTHVCMQITIAYARTRTHTHTHTHLHTYIFRVVYVIRSHICMQTHIHRNAHTHNFGTQTYARIH